MLTSISSTPSTPLANHRNLASGARELRSTRTAPSSPRKPTEMLITGSYVNGSALRSASLADRDLETQRRLLGVDAFVPSPESPLHHLRPTSPLSEASHLQDEIEQESIRERAARFPSRYVACDALATLLQPYYHTCHLASSSIPVLIIFLSITDRYPQSMTRMITLPRVLLASSLLPLPAASSILPCLPSKRNCP